MVAQIELIIFILEQLGSPSIDLALPCARKMVIPLHLRECLRIDSMSLGRRYDVGIGRVPSSGGFGVLRQLIPCGMANLMLCAINEVTAFNLNST